MDNRYTQKKVFSVDVETDGLYGAPFAIAAVVWDRDACTTVDKFEGLVDFVCHDEWVADNVVPIFAEKKPTYAHLEDMLNAFWDFWRKHSGEGTVVVAHCANPVEAGLFRRCVELDLDQRKFQGPMIIHDVGTLLLMMGADPHSINDFLKKHEIEPPLTGVDHDPSYDAEIALFAWLGIEKTLN